MKIHTKIVWDADGAELLDDWFAYDGPVAEAGGGSSKEIQQTSQGPWLQQQPYLVRGFTEAQKNFESSKPSYYPDSTVVPFSEQTKSGMGLMQGLAESSQLPGQAASQIGSTVGGDYLDSPENWAARTRNPASDYMNPNADAYAGVTTNRNADVGSDLATNRNMGASNPYAGGINPFGGVKGDVGYNPYMAQGGNQYIDAVTNSISRSVVPQVTSRFAGAGRTGESPIAQQAIAKGIADALAPYQFGSAEAEMGRRFSGGESLAGRAQSSSENQMNRMFTSGSDLVNRLFTSGEAQAGREFAGGESEAARLQAISEAQAGRQFSAGETEAQRAQVAREALAGRQFEAGADLTNRQFQGGENALARGMAEYDAERQRQLGAAGMAPDIEASRYQGADQLLKVGGLQEQKSGENLQDSIDRFNFDQNLPTQKLADYMAMVTGNYGAAGTNISNASYKQPFAQTFAQIGSGLGGLAKGAGAGK